MQSASDKSSKKTWKEVNKEFKERRKKWREQRLIKTAKRKEEKQKKDEEQRSADTNSSSKINNLSTISIAVPGSILENAQSAELRTYLAGQIARAACIYKIDEIVVFDDRGPQEKTDEYALDEARPSCLQLARILQYLECPQYLRKYFFPLHKDLQFAGLLNPLDAPHHLRQQDVSEYREGVVSNKPLKAGKGSLVNVGLLQDVRVDKVLTSNIRVTVKILEEDGNSNKLKGIIVPPSLPRAETGIYWGYTVRLANSLSDIFVKCPYSGGYDLLIGTSDKGTSIDDIEGKSCTYKHGLIVFGGLAGIEEAIEADSNFNVDDPSLIFDLYLNVCPQQGSRTIRTEEAILLTLAELRTKIVPQFPPAFHPQFSHAKNL
ncbi:hypothetical protein QAD02_018265 [Eretmocerus hayati]|uniref:Uncharacterized protein n=1 Tax=Eretmocerus hayati TaxID=131215 RepID=A0ACC2PHB4_9HYME|nr:hypothetical protein QAD02_018265 [Eretmocerus hayati]